MSEDPYVLAHTVQCKLKLAANRPDRNLRFILGHAVTLDSLMLRIVEIEEKQHHTHAVNDDQEETNTSGVSFDCTATQPSNKRTGGRKASPPPDAALAHNDRSDSDSDEYAFDNEEEDDEPSLGLTRFTSASAQPPRTIDPDSDSDEEDGPKSPPQMPSEPELRTIIEEESDGMMADLYESVRRCGCHDQKAPPISGMWELPQAESGGTQDTRRTAIISVSA